MLFHQPRTDAEFARYHAQARQAMAPIDAAPRPIRLVVYEYGPAAVQHGIDSIGFDLKRLPHFLERLRAARQAQRLSS